MNYQRVLALAVAAAGVMLTGVQAKAEEPHWGERREVRHDIAVDRYRLQRDLNRDRPWAAAAQARDIARDRAIYRDRR